MRKLFSLVALLGALIVSTTSAWALNIGDELTFRFTEDKAGVYEGTVVYAGVDAAGNHIYNKKSSGEPYAVATNDGRATKMGSLNYPSGYANLPPAGSLPSHTWSASYDENGRSRRSSCSVKSVGTFFVPDGKTIENALTITCQDYKERADLPRNVTIVYAPHVSHIPLSESWWWGGINHGSFRRELVAYTPAVQPRQPMVVGMTEPPVRR